MDSKDFKVDDMLRLLTKQLEDHTSYKGRLSKKGLNGALTMLINICIAQNKKIEIGFKDDKETNT